MSRRTAALGAALAGLAATGAVATVLAGRRWRAAEDPCGGTVLDHESGRGFKVERPDGAVLDGAIFGPEAASMVVLSHCWTGSRAVWEPVAARLVAAGRQVVLYDQRGHGASTAGAAPLTVELLGDDIAALL
jgi:alpha-beta hydrolase superfamily lysophospholipase